MDWGRWGDRRDLHPLSTRATTWRRTLLPSATSCIRKLDDEIQNVGWYTHSGSNRATRCVRPGSRAADGCVVLRRGFEPLFSP
jgi:hypothetical protein